MRYSLLGRTGLFVSELCFGTMTFGGKGALWEKIGKTPQQDAGHGQGSGSSIRCRHQFL